MDGAHYLDLVTKTVRELDSLKQLQAKIATEELERASKAESNNLFQKLVDKDPNLAVTLSSSFPQPAGATAATRVEAAGSKVHTVRLMSASKKGLKKDSRFR